MSNASSDQQPILKKVKELPSAEYLHECFLYDETTGILTWKVRPRSHFLTKQSHSCFNTKYAGTEAGTKLHRRGGKPHMITVGCGFLHLFAAHRLIFKMKGVEIPDGMEIDHKNRNPWDNSWENLRLATPEQNAQNRSGFRWKKNKLPKGVYKNGNLYQARVGFQKKDIYIGTFKTVADARQAYLVAAERIQGEFFHAAT